MPSEYAVDQVSITFWFEKQAVRDCVGHSIPVGNVMFETDFPHPTCRYGDVHQRLDDTFAGIGHAIRRRLL